MKKILVLFTIIAFTCSCGNYPYREQDIEKQIKEAVAASIRVDLLIPSSLKIMSLSYAPSETFYGADADYHELFICKQIYEKSLTDKKTSSSMKRFYKERINSLDEQMNTIVKDFYSPKILSPTVQTRPNKAYTVSVKYKCKNAFGVEIENTKYFNVLQSKSAVKKDNGNVAYAFDCEAFDSDISLMKVDGRKWI